MIFCYPDPFHEADPDPLKRNGSTTQVMEKNVQITQKVFQLKFLIHKYKSMKYTHFWESELPYKPQCIVNKNEFI